MPERLGKLAKRLKKFGVILESPTSGSHFKFVKGPKKYPISAHNGLKSEISDVYVRGVCRCFDIDPSDL